MAHGEMLAECKMEHEQTRKELDRHIDEAKPIRDSVVSLKVDVANLVGMRGAVYGIVVAIMMQIGGFFYLWGGINNMVQINTRRLDILEKKWDDEQREKLRDKAQSGQQVIGSVRSFTQG